MYIIGIFLLGFSSTLIAISFSSASFVPVLSCSWMINWIRSSVALCIPHTGSFQLGVLTLFPYSEGWVMGCRAILCNSLRPVHSFLRNVDHCGASNAYVSSEKVWANLAYDEAVDILVVTPSLSPLIFSE